MNKFESPIILKNVSFAYRNHKEVINNLNFEISSGLIYCLLGPNGSGKTTILKLISGLIKPNSGIINVLGLSLNDNKENILNDTFFTLDEPTFYWNLTGLENLKLICYYRKLPLSRIYDAMDKFDIPNNKMIFKNYSMGMKQRLSLAALFLFDPKLVVLDEPFNGLDPAGLIFLRNLILDLNNSKGVTFLISSHLLKEVGSFCTNYGILHNGNIEKYGIINNIEDLEKTYIETFSDQRL